MRWFAKMIFDGGGKYLKNPKKSNDYFYSFFKKIYKFQKTLTFVRYDRTWREKSRNVRSTLSFLIQKLRFRSASRGVVLIEFAVCMPVLIILLFYINDLVRIKRYYSQTEFVGQQIANMIQNISKTRSADKRKITKEDLARIHCLAWQTVYPGTTMFYTNSRHPFGHVPYTHLYYVRGEEEGKASCVFRLAVSNTGVTKPTDFISKVNVYKDNHSGSKIRFLTNTLPSNIYPTLKINKGEKKIIVETLMMRNTTWTNGAADKSTVGLHLVNPPMTKYGEFRYMFRSVVIFTPKPGLFDEDGPINESQS